MNTTLKFFGFQNTVREHVLYFKGTFQSKIFKNRDVSTSHLNPAHPKIIFEDFQKVSQETSSTFQTRL